MPNILDDILVLMESNYINYKEIVIKFAEVLKDKEGCENILREVFEHTETWPEAPILTIILFYICYKIENCNNTDVEVSIFEEDKEVQIDERNNDFAIILNKEKVKIYFTEHSGEYDLCDIEKALILCLPEFTDIFIGQITNFCHPLIEHMKTL